MGWVSGDAGGPESRRLVTVGQFGDLSQATIARSLLESAEIDAWLCDENVARITMHTFGGIRLQVDAADELAARELLEQAVPESIPFGQDKSFVQPRCPACGSPQVSTLPLFEAAEAGHESDAWRCDTCGAKWEQTDD